MVVATSMRKITYKVTCKAWLLFCPLYLADLNSDAPVPIPRHVPWWWFDFNFWLNDQLQWLVSLVNPDAVGYMFYGVRDLKITKSIEVPDESEL